MKKKYDMIESEQMAKAVGEEKTKTLKISSFFQACSKFAYLNYVSYK